LENKILIVDEAHNLPDRARKIFSPELLEESFQVALKDLGEQTKKHLRSAHPSANRMENSRQTTLSLDESAERNGYLFDEIRTTFSSIIALLNQTGEILSVENPIAEITPPIKELRRVWKNWEVTFIEYLSWKRENKIGAAEDSIVDCHFALQKFISTLNFFGPGFTCVVERTAAGMRLALVCLDPARPLEPIFKAASSTIFLSATLKPFETTRRVLGLDPTQTKSISLPPAFPRENREILILPQFRTTFGARERNFPRIAKLIAEMAEAVPGNVLVLFPSYTFLTKVAEFLPPVSARLLKQRPNVPDLERQEILRALSVAKSERILLFAVLGGMYAEGVDYPGELLSGVFVVSPALPQVSFERELLRRYFDEQEQAGFDYAYLQPGMTRVIQAAGRLIRGETDRGVIALICQRFLQMPYADYLPKDWFDETPAELIAQNPMENIANFFKTNSHHPVGKSS
jgi:DNA excision repair protein ERCC-2